MATLNFRKFLKLRNYNGQLVCPAEINQTIKKHKITSASRDTIHQEAKSSSIMYYLLKGFFQAVDHFRIIRITSLILLWPFRSTSLATLFRDSSISLAYTFRWRTNNRHNSFRRLWRHNFWRCLLWTHNGTRSTPGLSLTGTLSLARASIRLIAFHIESIALLPSV